MRLTGVWSLTQVADFLEEVRIPVRLACRTPNGTLWMVSLWYRYADDRLQCATSSRADIVRFLDDDPHVAFEVSTNRPPYRGVRGNGTATLRPDADLTLLRSLVERYLGGTNSTLAARLLDPDRDETAIEIELDRLYTWDFSDGMADAGQREDETSREDGNGET